MSKNYFWTATLNNRNKLLADDTMKEVIISSFDYLSHEKKIQIYAFVLLIGVE